MEEIKRKQSGFMIGDIVELKSGGPDMTVSRLESEMDNSIGCTWFDRFKLQHGSFDADTLERVAKNRKGLSA
jgi:uncharacterized protein YodC (DUF2158 family)